MLSNQFSMPARFGPSMRQVHTHYRTGALAIAAAKPYVSTFFFKQILSNPEAQAGSYSFFGGEERSKQFCSVFPWNPCTIIGNRDAHTALARLKMVRRTRAEPNSATFAGSIDCVDHKIGQNLLQFAFHGEKGQAGLNLPLHVQQFVLEFPFVMASTSSITSATSRVV